MAPRNQGCAGGGVRGPSLAWAALITTTRSETSASTAQPEMLFCSARSAFPAPLWKCWGSGTLTDHDAGESQDEGGHEGRGHDGEDQREWQVGLRGGRHWKTGPHRVPMTTRILL